MATKDSKTKNTKSSANRDAARRTRLLQIVVAIFSILLILSMVLSSLTSQ